MGQRVIKDVADKRTKVGGQFGHQQGQALRVLKKKFSLVLIEKQSKIFSSKTLLASALPPGRCAFFFVVFSFGKSLLHPANLMLPRSR